MKKKPESALPEQPAEIGEAIPEAPKTKKPRKAAGRKKAEKPAFVSETPTRKPARKPAKLTAGKTPVRAVEPPAAEAGKTAKPGRRKAVETKAEKTSARKPGPKKTAGEKPKKAAAAGGRKTPGRKPGRKPGLKETKLVGRKTDLIKMGEGAFLYSLELTRRVEELEKEIIGYQRLIEAVRTLFSREMEEIEDLMTGLLE